MSLINESKNTILAQNIEVASSVLGRVKGLLGRESLGQDQALIINPCDSVHTFFMRFTIDVIFVDANNRVLKLIPNMRPFRISGVYFKSRLVVELPSGTVEKTHTQIGDLLSL